MRKGKGYFYDAQIRPRNGSKPGLFELRGVGDYGATAHVSRQDAANAVRAAENFLSATKSLIQKATE